jgi:hypothetical protein
MKLVLIDRFFFGSGLSNPGNSQIKLWRATPVNVSATVAPLFASLSSWLITGGSPICYFKIVFIYFYFMLLVRLMFD